MVRKMNRGQDGFRGSLWRSLKEAGSQARHAEISPAALPVPEAHTAPRGGGSGWPRLIAAFPCLSWGPAQRRCPGLTHVTSHEECSQSDSGISVYDRGGGHFGCPGTNEGTYRHLNLSITIARPHVTFFPSRSIISKRKRSSLSSSASHWKKISAAEPMTWFKTSLQPAGSNLAVAQPAYLHFT